jgi:hypothetical protein
MAPGCAYTSRFCAGFDAPDMPEVEMLDTDVIEIAD